MKLYRFDLSLVLQNRGRIARSPDSWSFNYGVDVKVQLNEFMGGGYDFIVQDVDVVKPDFSSHAAQATTKQGMFFVNGGKVDVLRSQLLFMLNA